jgi:hypothetical protein
MEGKLLFRKAAYMLGAKVETIQKLAQGMGLAA